MIPSLNLVDHLLEMGRRYQTLGRTRDATRVLEQLAAFRELPAEAAEETQVRLAELHLKRRKYARARRYLTAALGLRPDEARYHHLMATAVLAEGRGNPERAAEHFRRSLELDPAQVKCLCEYGLLAVRLGRTEEGLTHLRKAVELAPADPEALARLVKGLRLADRGREARQAIRAALFRNPRGPRFRKLWGDYRFQQIRRRQEVRRLARSFNLRRGEGPVLLPFVRPSHETVAPDARTGMRADAPESVPGPHRPRLAHRPDQRNVQ